MTAYQSVHATTDPFANVANTWFPMYNSPKYQDVPEAAMDKTDVQPFVFVSNWSIAEGGGTVTWGDVEATGTVIPEPATIIIWSLLGGLGIGFGYWRRKRAA